MMMMMMTMERYSQHLILNKFNKIYRMFSKKKNKSKYNKYNKYNKNNPLLNTNTKDNNTKTTIIKNDDDDTTARKNYQNSNQSNDKFQFPWKGYEGTRLSYYYYYYYRYFFSKLHTCLQGIRNQNGKDIMNYNDIETNCENLFKEATMSIFQHKLIKMHQLNSRQSIGVDILDSAVTTTTYTTNTTDNNSSSDHSNNTSSKNDINNDPFPLTFIFESIRFDLM